MQVFYFLNLAQNEESVQKQQQKCRFLTIVHFSNGKNAPIGLPAGSAYLYTVCRRKCLFDGIFMQFVSVLTVSHPVSLSEFKPSKPIERYVLSPRKVRSFPQKGTFFLPERYVFSPKVFCVAQYSHIRNSQRSCLRKSKLWRWGCKIFSWGLCFLGGNGEGESGSLP